MSNGQIFLGTMLCVLVSTPALAADCEPTPQMTTGTHYKPITTERVDVGAGLLVEGRVLSADGCRAIPGAKVAHWQANSQGVYVDELRAYLPSGPEGVYRFDTEWPAAFVPHIHFQVSAVGYQSVSTQWVGSEVVDRIIFDIVLRPQ